MIITEGSTQYNDYVRKLEQENEALEADNAQLRTALKMVDRMFKSRQGLDYDYDSQEEHDVHELVMAALATKEE